VISFGILNLISAVRIQFKAILYCILWRKTKITNENLFRFFSVKKLKICMVTK